jgi:hypothetical protein
VKSERWRQKPATFEAVSVKDLLAARANQTLELAPDWVKRAITTGKLDLHPNAYVVIVYTFGVPMSGAEGDWVLCDEDATLFHVPGTVAGKFYERVD